MTRAPLSRIPILSSIQPLVPTADGWLSDVWGVIHNGRAAFPVAIDACCRFQLEFASYHNQQLWL